MKSILTTIALLPAIVLAAPQPNAEQQVFGSQRSSQQATQAQSAQTNAGGAKPAQGATRKTRRLNPRDEARQMFERFNSGDMLYASRLKDAANNGNPWAALQYGYLAHKGQLPSLKGPDYALAYKAYMKAVKNPDGSLTGNHLAAYNIGLMYFFGSGQLKQDGRTALRWFQTASQAYREAKKSKTAIFWPASLYSAQILQNGYAGVTADPTAARAHWEAAIRSKDPAALHGYAAAIYSNNPFAAVRVYQSAADRWHVPSMIALARWYANGDKLHQADPEQTATWLLIASFVDKRYTSNAESVLKHLNAESQKQVRTRASRWIQSKGLRLDKFDYASPLNDDPAARR